MPADLHPWHVGDRLEEHSDKLGYKFGLLDDKHMPGFIHRLQGSAKDPACQGFRKMQGGQPIACAADDQSGSSDGFDPRGRIEAVTREPIAE